MIVDIANLNLHDRPVLILKNLDEKPVTNLGNAFNIRMDIAYNEVSSITFDIPAYVNGIPTPDYEKVVGARLVDFSGVGVFILVDPETVGNGVSEIKSCKAYSREYEMTYKKMSLPEGTYNFYNTVSPTNTILGIITEYLPYWKIGSVDSNLIGKYRTFAVNDTNIYDFIKNTCQKTFGCIFDFDTYTRTINVRSTVKRANNDLFRQFASFTGGTHSGVTYTWNSQHTSCTVNGSSTALSFRNQYVDYNALPTGMVAGKSYKILVSTTNNDIKLAFFCYLNGTSNTYQSFKFSGNSNFTVPQAATGMIVRIEIASGKTANNDTISCRIISADEGSIDTKPVFLSTKNLVKEIDRKEDTENIFTCLDVNGAEGVTIRSVNPLGTNKIFNLDYFMGSEHFSQDIVTKWHSWKTELAIRQDEYYLLTIQRMMKTTEIVALEARINKAKKEDLGALEAQRSVCIEALARLSSNSSGYAQALSDLTSINNDIAAKESSIASDMASLSSLETEKDSLTDSLVAINAAVSFEAFFTDEEILLLKQYFKEDAISESSFVYPEAVNYSAEDVSRSISNITTSVMNSIITTTPIETGKNIYSCSGGHISVGSMLSADVVKATAEFTVTGGHLVLTAYLGAGTYDSNEFPNGCLTVVTNSGSISATGNSITASGGSGDLYFTRNTTEFEKYSVEWDLYQYGMDCLSRLAYPSYSFSVDTANFLSSDEFAAFKNSIELGKKIYLDVNNDMVEENELFDSRVGAAISEESIVGTVDERAKWSILTPFFIGFSVDFEDPSSLSLKFGDKYNQSDSVFSLVDLLEQSVSMGKTVDTSRFGYNSFIDSGASTAVKDYMDSALDVAKQSILSSTGVSIEWDESGMTFRKKNQDGTGYLPTQIKIINDNIVFTNNAWQTAKMAIGHFADTNTGDSWGVIAPNIVGTLFAGQNLVIESTKQDGGVAVFKVDANGAVLHNSKLDIVRANTGSGSTHILLDPNLGFGIGAYPVASQSGNTWNWNDGQSGRSNNAKFWVDMAGNVHIKGTLEGADGTFSGSLQAATGTFSGTLNAAGGTFTGIVQASDFQNSAGVSMMKQGKFTGEYLDLKGLTVYNNDSEPTFSVDMDGNVMVSGDITMETLSTISWSQIVGDPATNSNLSAKFNDYVTTTALGTRLGSYVTSSALNSTLGSYTTRSDLTSMLSSYVSDSELNTALDDYIDAQDLNSRLSGYALLQGLRNGTTTISANCIQTEQIAADHISLYGLSVYRRDASGNPLSDVSLSIDSRGNVTLGPGASISWDRVDDKPTFNNVAFTGNYNDLSNKPTIPSAVSLPSYLKESYIDEARIESPSIYGGKYYATGDGSSSAGGGAAYYIYDGYNQSTHTLGTKIGYISYDSNGDGLDSSQRRVKFRTVGSTALKIQSGLNLSIETGAWNDNNDDPLNNYSIYLMSDTVLAKAVYLGSNASWGSSLPSVASSNIGRLFFLTSE